jgi:hypothetical protein
MTVRALAAEAAASAVRIANSVVEFGRVVPPTPRIMGWPEFIFPLLAFAHSCSGGLAHAARRLWRALNGKAPGPPFHILSSQRRQRLALALRALDARMDGNTYRAIADVLFGATRIPERAWKTHDLRNRTIRLVQSGFALMRGGYRDLLRQSRRKK